MTGDVTFDQRSTDSAPLPCTAPLVPLSPFNMAHTSSPWNTMQSSSASLNPASMKADLTQDVSDLDILPITGCRPLLMRSGAEVPTTSNEVACLGRNSTYDNSSKAEELTRP